MLRVMCAVTAIAAAALVAVDARSPQTVFKGGVDLVNVTVTVSDEDGRFVPGLRREDFIVYDEGSPQEIVSFSSERVPVSLGILLDVSGSMSDSKMASARAAITRFAFDLLGAEDDLFLAEFGSTARMLQTWTLDRDTFSRALDRARSGRTQRFGTAIYDAVRAAVPVAASGIHTKKALLVISDGQDTRSRTPLKKLQAMIRTMEVLVYALGVDDGPIGRSSRGVDAGALRNLTDETGGRTEVVRGFSNLNAATRRLADELNGQYVLAYATPGPRDGRWHSIRVEVRGKRLIVRSRAGYTAS